MHVGDLLWTQLFQILESKFPDIENIEFLISKSCFTFERHEVKTLEVINYFLICHIEVLKMCCIHCSG
jgi:hypothetical protein